MVDHADTILRPATREDQEGIIALVDQVLTEFGETICLEPGGAEADLQTIEPSYFDAGGCFWVMTEAVNGSIIGTHSVIPIDSSTCKFKRLYLHRSYRGSDCGMRLMQVAIDWVKAQPFPRVEFWSDARFHRAHRFFKKCGFTATGEIRTMHDSHEPYQELQFEMNL